MDKKFDVNKYNAKYQKEHYSKREIILSEKEKQILEEYSKNLSLSKSQLMQKCLIYCYENDIDLT